MSDLQHPAPALTSSTLTATPPRTLTARLRYAASVVMHHARKHVGVGMICAVAYFDPGNWGVDLQAGSEFGYRLLFVVLLAGIFAVFLQVLATRLGCVTGIDLAAHTRLLLHSRPRHTLLIRWCALYPLYVLAEIAIIATDLAELLGSAIALCMLFPNLELWHGVLITAFDVVLVLAVGDPLGGARGKKGGVRGFELLVGAMVIAVLVCMVIVISRVHVDWRTAFEGYLPSKYVFRSGGLYTSVGILGATVMPHSLFLGSALATQDRVGFRSSSAHSKEQARNSESTLHEPPPPAPSSGHHNHSHNHDGDGLSLVESKASEDSLASSTTTTTPSFDEAASTKAKTKARRTLPALLRAFVAGCVESVCAAFRRPPVDVGVYSKTPSASAMAATPARAATRHAERENNPDAFVRAHLAHGTVDVVGSLLGFAVVINSMILMLAAAVFYYGRGRTATVGDSGSGSPASLFDAYDLIRDVVGQGAATLFAVALLAAGQSSSLIATVAGQVVCEGFLQWRVSPVVRRLFTRLLAVIPSMAVAVSLGRSGIDTLLVVSQVVLSIVLPFITFPLLWCTASRAIMSVRREAPSSPGGFTAVDVSVAEGASQGEMVDYSNNRLTVFVGAAIWLVVVAANMYVIVELALGNSG